MGKSKTPTRKQVAALPVRRDAGGDWRVLLITSRQTRRLIVPKGWPMKGHKDYRAAAIEAMQEAGVIGRIHRKSLGTYIYWKRLADRFDLCRVKVFVLEVKTQLPVWREKGERRAAWFRVEDAASLVDEVGLADLIRSLPRVLDRKAGGKANRARKKLGG